MKTYAAIFLTIALVAVCGGIDVAIENSTGNRGPFTALLIFATSIWMAIDSKKLNAKKYKSFFAMGPVGIFFAGLFIWVITFPGYLSLKYKIKNNLAELKPSKN